MEAAEALRKLETGPEGLTRGGGGGAPGQTGPNEVSSEKHHDWATPPLPRGAQSAGHSAHGAGHHQLFHRQGNQRFPRRLAHGG